MSQATRGSPLFALSTDSAWLAEVIKDAQAGDELAFDKLFQYYNPRICTYLARMVGNDEEGRDLAQETFVKVWRALPRMHDETRFDTWLYRIATNTAIDYLRRRNSRWPTWMRPEESILENMSMPAPEIQVEEAEQIRLVLAQLSPKYRACLLLQVVAGFTQREIAELLNISEKSISIYVSRGSEQFRRAYERLENEQSGDQLDERRNVTALSPLGRKACRQAPG